jgi:hypothetical protein
MDLSNIEEMVHSYGSDLLILVGGSLFTSGEDLVANCRRFHDETLRASLNKS